LPRLSISFYKRPSIFAQRPLSGRLINALNAPSWPTVACGGVSPYRAERLQSRIVRIARRDQEQSVPIVASNEREPKSRFGFGLLTLQAVAT
jgi:hypothetical protein